ncbi:unnamed protein product [Closterium sp. NIES-53]
MAKGCPSPPPLFASITAVFLEGGFVTPSFADVASILQCGGGTVIPSSALHSPTAKTLLAAFSNPSNNTPTASTAATAAPAAPADIRKDEDRSQGCQRHGETKILLVVYADVPANTPLVSVTPRLALLLRNDYRNQQTWYLDSCCGQHMVGSVRYISNISRAHATYVTVANNEQLRANAQGIVVLQARDSNTHISFNDVLYVPDLRFNLLSAGQLRDCGVMLATDLYTHDLILTYAPPDTPPESHKYLGRARSMDGVYVLDFDLPTCQASSDELVDLVPLDFPFMNHGSIQTDGRGPAAVLILAR